MERPSISLTVNESSENSTPATLSSAATTEVLIPGLQQFVLMLLDDCKQFCQLARAKSVIPGQPHRTQPELGRQFIPVNMHVRRFIWLMAVEINPVRTRRA